MRSQAQRGGFQVPLLNQSAQDLAPRAAILAPLDNLTWDRRYLRKLFGFEYLWEVYKPVAERRWGYYVLPFRAGDRIVGRVDLKADRKARRLLVLNAHEEDGVDVEHCCAGLAMELRALGDWLGLDEVVVERSNGFSRRLARSVN